MKYIVNILVMRERFPLVLTMESDNEYKDTDVANALLNTGLLKIGDRIISIIFREVESILSVDTLMKKYGKA